MKKKKNTTVDAPVDIENDELEAVQDAAELVEYPTLGKVQKMPVEFKKNGMRYKQIWRNGPVAVLEQMSGVIVSSYEVVIIQFHEGRKIFDNFAPATEYAPGNELWGQCGWTYRCNEKEKAIEAAKDLCVEIHDKKIKCHNKFLINNPQVSTEILKL